METKTEKPGDPYHPFDRSIKDLSDTFFEDFARQLGIDPNAVEIIDVELTTVGKLVDKAWRVKKPQEHLVLLEFQSTRDADFLLRLNSYVSLFAEKNRLPVRAVVFLLRPEAESPQMTGEWSLGLAGQPAWQILRFDLVRIHQIPVEQLLAGGLGLLPFAPVAAGASEKLDQVCHAVIDRIQREAAPTQAQKLLVATYLLMGLRYTEEIIHAVFRGVQWMKDSLTYQAIVREGIDIGLVRGRQEGRQEAVASLRRLLHHLTGRRLGEPPIDIAQKIQAEERIEVLESWIERSNVAPSWAEVVAD